MPDLQTSGRDDWIRTSDPLTPSQVRYQTAPRPEAMLLLAFCLATGNTLTQTTQPMQELFSKKLNLYSPH